MNKRRLLAAGLSLFSACVPKNRRQAVFCSFPDFSDNARAVYEEMVRRDEFADYRLVWLIKGGEPPALSRGEWVKMHSLRGLWAYCRAGVVFHTHGMFNNRPARGQRIVSLWHGMPLKTIMRLDPTHPAGETFDFTFCIATSPLFQGVMARAFACPEDRCLVTGQPRCDRLFAPDDALAQMGIDRAAYRRVLLWMPTYRRSEVGDVRCDGDGGGEQGVAFLTAAQLEALNTLLAEQNCLMLVKLHPMQAAVAAEKKRFSHLRLVRRTPGELYSLVGQADALLTDCSSVYVDYLLLDRPIGFVFGDRAQYEQNRGFVFDDITNYMPGPQITNYDQLAAFVKTVAEGEDSYAAARQTVRAQFHRYVDGRSTERLLKEVFDE